MRSHHLEKIKLRVISLRASIIRAGIFALAWVIFPFWLFALVALYLYFVPSSQAQRAAVPFFVLLLLSALEPSGFYFAIIFGILFWYILLIKELYLIDRKSAYEALIFALSFFLLRIFYLKMGGGLGIISIGTGLIVAGIIAWLFASFIKNFSSDPNKNYPLRRAMTWIAFFLSWQVIIVGLFLPLDFIYQSVAVFLLIVTLIELFSQYIFTDFHRVKILTTVSVIFALLVIVLSSARWGL